MEYPKNFGVRNDVIQVPPQSQVCEADYELVTIMQAGGYGGRARLFECPGAERAIVYLHGIQSHGGWFLPSCDFLYRRGITVLAPDRRGSGLNATDRGHCDSAGQLLDDLDGCVDWLRCRSGQETVDLVAVSWSGKLAVVYAAGHRDKIRSVVLVAPGLRARIDISLKEKILIGAEGLLHPHRQHEIPLNEPTLFTENPAMLRFIVDDPLKLTCATASFLVTSHKLDMTVPKMLSRLTMPVYLFLAELDRIIDNEATIDLLGPVLSPIGSVGGAARVYRGAHHTLDFEPDPQGFFDDLARTLSS